MIRLELPLKISKLLLNTTITDTLNLDLVAWKKISEIQSLKLLKKPI